MGKATLSTHARCKIEIVNDVVDEKRLRMSRKSLTRLEESDKRHNDVCMSSVLCGSDAPISVFTDRSDADIYYREMADTDTWYISLFTRNTQHATSFSMNYKAFAIKIFAPFD